MRVTVRGLKLPCLREKPQKHVFLDVSEDVVMSFCVAGVALCDIGCLSEGMCVHDRREGKVAASFGGSGCAQGKSHKNVYFSMCWKMCSCRFASQAWHFATLHTLHASLHIPHSKFTLHTLHSTLHTVHSTLYIPHFTLHTVYNLHTTLYTPYFTLYTSHFTLQALHLTLHTSHSTLHTPDFLHFTL